MNFFQKKVDLALKDVKHRKVYSVADWFLKEKERIEKYLCHVTDDLFRPTNRIMLFDLTNFYFEGRKEGSQKAQYGRSKENRRDCKLLVLALAINTDGFIRYSSILEGNTADPKSLPDMVDKLIAENPAGMSPDEKVLVVMDAGISTKENLDLIKAKGYNYLCVTRKALTNYTVKPGAKAVTVYDCKKRPIELTEVQADGDDDYLLKVKSPSKALKEQSMNRAFRKRFEAGMETIAASLTKKGGTKKYEAVIKRIGKLEGRYPSIARYYSIAVEKDEKDRVTSVTWTVEVPDEEVSGTYFLRTNVRTLDEKTAWDYYRSTSGRFACKEPRPRDRVLEPPAEDRPPLGPWDASLVEEPAPDIPPEGRAERCTPVPSTRHSVVSRCLPSSDCWPTG